MNLHNTPQRRPSHETADPLSLPQARQQRPAPTVGRSHTSSESRISVVLQSPSRPQDYQTTVMPSDERIVSDLSRKFKREAAAVSSSSSVKQTPVPLPARPGSQPAPKRSAGPHTSTSHHPAPRTVVKETPVPIPQVPTVNRVGRPKGWKPGMSYAAMRGHAGPSSAPSRASSAQGNGNGIVKRRGRPPRQASPPLRVLYLHLEPKFLVFGCEWEGCKAELQNLDTLRRHVEKVHVRHVDDGLCRWGKCRGMDPMVNHGSGLPAHVEERHLIPFGWHVGDGPKNTLQIPKRKGNAREDSEEDHQSDDGKEEEEEEEEEIPSYLKDRDGHQVTPSIKDQKLEDYLTEKENRKRLRRLLMERERNLPGEQDDTETQSQGADGT